MTAALASAAPPADAKAKLASSCAPRGSTVVAKAGRARIFHTTANSVFVCRPGVRYRIGVRFDSEELGACDEDVSDFALTPRYAAWASQRACGDDIPYWNVSVRRIYAKTRTQTYATGAGCEVDCPGGYARRTVGPIQRITLTAHGALAWSAQDQVERRFFEISKIVNGQPVRLARATGIDPTSVRWAGQLVMWTQAGMIQSG